MFSINISPLKVLNVSNRGSLTIISPLAIAEGLFYFKNILQKKKGFSMFCCILHVKDNQLNIYIFL